MTSITLKQPRRIVFGCGCLAQLADEYLSLGLGALLVVTAEPILPLIRPFTDRLEAAHVRLHMVTDIAGEPTVGDFRRTLAAARAFGADSVVGIGGGSVMDVAKLVATLLRSTQDVADCFGIGRVAARGVWMACVPTTAGTGSEVSPNAILLDESDGGKKGVISDHLLADVAYLDPELTVTVPPRITAETGLDALTHCIEVYTNRFAHPMVDLYARAGIGLIAGHLERTVADGHDVEARTAMLRGSMYGGLGLGPVNTAAVHALAYPVGGMFHKSHGLSNAVLLPTVMRFNIEACPERYADVALALGCTPGPDARTTALRGADRVAELSARCGIPATLTAIGIPASAVDDMARAAMQQQRLLRNNPRPVSEADAAAIYRSLC